ncbi:DUF4365 domain-containing protein [Vibrio harveyi]|uniref:DUF4365 domain-containing protein n=1 Tax=Vibrio harveyi TaxID=669 RepID=UPI003BF712FD
MKYQISKQNGDAGEYYFSFWVSVNFGWPCRLLDIDLGLDAQLEMCDSQHIAEGKFIAIQLKSTQGMKPNTSLELKNLLYWKSMKEPVIVVSIINIRRKPQMYWKIVNGDGIDKLIAKAKKNKKKATSITFTARDRLTKKK